VRVRVAVVGAGAVGAACAARLVGGGARVRVLDPGAGRAAASWAAVGLLLAGAGHDNPPPWHAMARRSMELWPEIGRRHPEVELRRIGMTLLGDAPEWLDWRRREGFTCEPVEWRGRHAVRFPEVEAIRPHRLAPALLAGIDVETMPVGPLEPLLAAADVVVVASGAWASEHLRAAGLDLEVRPVRGQMMVFESGDIDTALYEAAGEEVAAPRADGRVVVGTTVEDAGFAATTHEDDLGALEAWARREIPGLGRREDAWAGLRPDAGRTLPVVGWAAPRVVAAVGHYRNGILLAPATGELVADLVLGRTPRLDPGPFAPSGPAG
jgi:glycine oxidase